jgi:hypothetical protein
MLKVGARLKWGTEVDARTSQPKKKGNFEAAAKEDSAKHIGTRCSQPQNREK